MDVGVKNNNDLNRFEVDLGDQIAVMEYMRAGNNIIFTHTEVPQAYEGQGIANQMAAVALAYAKSEGLKVQPLCPFVKGYIEKHPEYKEISW